MNPLVQEAGLGKTRSYRVGGQVVAQYVDPNPATLNFAGIVPASGHLGPLVLSDNLGVNDPSILHTLDVNYAVPGALNFSGLPVDPYGEARAQQYALVAKQQADAAAAAAAAMPPPVPKPRSVTPFTFGQPPPDPNDNLDDEEPEPGAPYPIQFGVGGAVPARGPAAVAAAAPPPPPPPGAVGAPPPPPAPPGTADPVTAGVAPPDGGVAGVDFEATGPHTGGVTTGGIPTGDEEGAGAAGVGAPPPPPPPPGAPGGPPPPPPPPPPLVAAIFPGLTSAGPTVEPVHSSKLGADPINPSTSGAPSGSAAAASGTAPGVSAGAAGAAGAMNAQAALLEQIRKGKQLRKTGVNLEKPSPTEKAKGKGPKSNKTPAGTSSGGDLADAIAAALEDRKAKEAALAKLRGALGEDDDEEMPAAEPDDNDDEWNEPPQVVPGAFPSSSQPGIVPTYQEPVVAPPPVNPFVAGPQNQASVLASAIQASQMRRHGTTVDTEMGEASGPPEESMGDAPHSLFEGRATMTSVHEEIRRRRGTQVGFAGPPEPPVAPPRKRPSAGDARVPDPDTEWLERGIEGLEEEPEVKSKRRGKPPGLKPKPPVPKTKKPSPTSSGKGKGKAKK